MKLINPFLIKNDELKISIQPWKYRKWSQERQSQVTFSVNDNNEREITLNDNQINTIKDLMTDFWFKIDKVEHLWDSEFTKIILNPQDQIDMISTKNKTKRTSPINIIHEPWNISDTKDFFLQGVQKIIDEWWWSNLEKVVYNWDEGKYASFCNGLAASIKYVFDQAGKQTLKTE